MEVTNQSGFIDKRKFIYLSDRIFICGNSIRILYLLVARQTKE